MLQAVTRVKICGIRGLGDALLAADGGADAVGVLLGQKHPSPDFIAADQAQSDLEDSGELIRLVEQTAARVVQLHGAVTPEGLRELHRRLPGLTLREAIQVLTAELRTQPSTNV